MEVRVNNLTKRFGKTTAVDQINITFKDGKLTGLLGPSGCGKSTTLYMIAGLESATEGQIIFGDQDVTTWMPEKRNIAQLHNISCEHLSRIFKKNLGLTFKEYLYSIRLTHACRLLLHTNKSTLEIALEAGFPDLRSFGRQFDRVYHMTPKEYRKRFQKN